MAAINFPSSPSNGDTHTVGGVTYTYNSAETKWKTTINSNAFLPLSGGTVSGTLTVNDDLAVDTDTLFVDVSTDRVGINTASPTVPLQVNGTGQIARFESSSSSAVVRIANTETNPCEFVYTSDLAINVGGSERTRIDSSGNLRFNSGYGSVATAYGCRAWVNFQGSGTVTIRDNGNVSSITDNGGADYTLNFTSNMPDANYCPVFGGGQYDAGTANFAVGIKTNTNTEGPATLMSTSQLRILAQNGSGGNEDLSYVCVAIFR